MLRELLPHPDTPSAAIDQILVTVSRPAPTALALDFVVRGAVREIRLPPQADPVRTDGLWRHTCFEAFVDLPDAAYLECNLSPSRQWAAYRFDSYRGGMRPLALAGVPDIEDRLDDEYRFRSKVALHGVPGLPSDQSWRLAVSAVIEDANGTLSYWALAHPRGKPDFHHRDCFVLELAPA
jgi:hypothetical protein